MRSEDRQARIEDAARGDPARKSELFDSTVEGLAVEPEWAMERVRRAIGTKLLLADPD